MNLMKNKYYLVAIIASLIAVALCGGAYNFAEAYRYHLPMKGTLFHCTIEEFGKIFEVEAARNGKTMIGDPLLFEEKDAPASNTPFVGGLTGFICKKLRIDTPTTTWLFDFIFPSLLFMLIHFWGFPALFPDTKRTKLIPYSLIFTILFLMVPGQRNITRYLHSQITFIPVMFLFIASLSLHSMKKETLFYLYPLMLIFNGTLLIMDPWFAILLFVTQFSVGLICISGKNYRVALLYLFLLMAICINGVPELLRLMDYSHHEGFKLMTERQGAVHTFIPDYPRLLLWVVLLAGSYLTAKKFGFSSDRNGILKRCGLIILFLLGIYFQNVITQNRLYYQGVHVAAVMLIPAGIIATILFMNLMERFSNQIFRSLIISLAIILSIFYHAHELYYTTRFNEPPYFFDSIWGYRPLAIQKYYRETYLWIKQNTSDTSVFLIEPSTDCVFYTLTDRYCYSSALTQYICREQKTLNQRYFPFLFMRAKARMETPFDPIYKTHEVLLDYNARDYTMLYASAGSEAPHFKMMNDKLKSFGLPPIFAEQEKAGVKKFQSYINSIYDSYEKFIAERKPICIKDLFIYKCDYVLWGPQEKRFAPDYNPDSDTSLKRIFTDSRNEVSVYKVL